MPVLSTIHINSPLGILRLSGNKTGLQEVAFVDEEVKLSEKIPESLADAVHQLQEYFEGRLKVFNLALNFEGTDLQKQVWQELLKIPYGKTLTYLTLARKLGDEKAIRAVASVNAKNKLAIIVPCHRVIGVGGKLTGYAWGLHRKKWLLELENDTRQTVLF